MNDSPIWRIIINSSDRIHEPVETRLNRQSPGPFPMHSSNMSEEHSLYQLFPKLVGTVHKANPKKVLLPFCDHHAVATSHAIEHVELSSLNRSDQFLSFVFPIFSPWSIDDFVHIKPNEIVLFGVCPHVISIFRCITPIGEMQEIEMIQSLLSKQRSHGNYHVRQDSPSGLQFL